MSTALLYVHIHMSTALLHVTRCRALIAQPLAYESLAHPSGLALSPTGGALYVTEMMTNRVLRFVQVTKLPLIIV